jgi:DNA processing protein
VVGTRKLTEYGRQSAYKIGYELAACGAVVVSGLALGIDAVAACGALDARGKTIAVLGSGVDHVYPAAHKKLADKIVKNGLLISEYPPLESPNRGSFPTRNRIISGLSQGTLVVEANDRSGALITAKDAILQGRSVYALPGNVDNPTSNGTNALIKDGATPITCAADILENYKYIYRESVDMSAISRVGARSQLKAGALAAYGVEESDWSFKPKEKGSVSLLLHDKKRVDGETVNKMVGNTEYPKFEDPPALKKEISEGEDKQRACSDNSSEILKSLDKKYSDVFEAIPIGKPANLAELCRCGYDSRTVMSVLTTLELKGLVNILPGGLYSRK